VPGEDADTVRAELGEILDRLAGTVPDFHYRLRDGLHRETFEADPGSDIVRTLLRQVERALGHPPVIRAEPFWTDCALLDRAGIPCLLFGVNGGGAHADLEWADLDSVHQVAAILTDTITEFCA
jgi:acetylornithine deacetylase